jgi:flagellar hook-associated protein 2
VVAQGSTSSVQITSADYGSQRSLSVTASGSDELGLAGSFSGSDVAGTIDGVAATGDGQVLADPISDPILAGMSLLVTTPGISSSTNLGTFTYAPGLAGALASLSTTSTGTNGELTTTISGLQNNNKSLSSQITLEQQLLTQQQNALMAEFNNLEATLASLKSQSSFLSSLSSGGAASGSVSSSRTTG